MASDTSTVSIWVVTTSDHDDYIAGRRRFPEGSYDFDSDRPAGCCVQLEAPADEVHLLTADRVSNPNRSAPTARLRHYRGSNVPATDLNTLIERGATLTVWPAPV